MICQQSLALFICGRFGFSALSLSALHNYFDSRSDLRAIVEYIHERHSLFKVSRKKTNAPLSRVYTVTWLSTFLLRFCLFLKSRFVTKADRLWFFLLPSQFLSVFFSRNCTSSLKKLFPMYVFFALFQKKKRKHWLKFIFLDVFNDNNGSFLSETKSKKEPLTISRIIVLAANLSRVVLRVIAVSLTSNWITRDTRERLVFTKRLLEQPVFFFLGPALDRGRSFDSQATVRIDANGIVSASGKRIISSHALHSRVNCLSINSHCSWCFVELFIYSVWTFLRAVRTTTCSFVNVDFQLVRMKRNQFSGDDAIHPAWLKYYFNWLPRAPWDAN